MFDCNPVKFDVNKENFDNQKSENFYLENKDKQIKQ